MGGCMAPAVQAEIYSQNQSVVSEPDTDNLDNFNVHQVHPDIKIHTVISNEMDYNHKAALEVPLGEVSDEQLIAELAERGLNPDLALEIAVDVDSHLRSMKIPLEAVTDTELLTEVARRRLDIRDNVNEGMVNETYEMGRVIGHGASGKVYKCKRRADKIEFACKVIQKDARMNDAQSMSTEVEIMKRLRHENVVSMFELFQSSWSMWIVLELVDGGDLKSFLAKNRSLYTESMAAKHFKQILSGIHYLHSKGVIHRDLKLENILLKRDDKDEYVAKIADFGLSALVRIGEDGYHTSKSSKRKEFDSLHEPWGTAEYEAPELLMGAYGPQVDMWSVGCMLFEMLAGYKAFQREEGEKNLSGLHDRIKKGQFDMKKAVWWTVTPNAKDLINKLLTVDPTKRYSATDALKHRWIRYFVTGEAAQSSGNNHHATS